jgi:hypothetical protein
LEDIDENSSEDTDKDDVDEEHSTDNSSQGEDCDQGGNYSYSD